MITVECGLPISAACTADIITADIIRNVVSSSDDDIMVAYNTSRQVSRIG